MAKTKTEQLVYALTYGLGAVEKKSTSSKYRRFEVKNDPVGGLYPENTVYLVGKGAACVCVCVCVPLRMGWSVATSISLNPWELIDRFPMP